MESRSIVHFDPFVSRVEAGFWHELARRKLEKYKLSEAEQRVLGFYSNGELVIINFQLCSERDLRLSHVLAGCYNFAWPHLITLSS